MYVCIKGGSRLLKYKYGSQITYYLGVYYATVYFFCIHLHCMHIRYTILREKALRMMTGMHISTSILNKCVILECQNIDLLPEIEKFEN